MKINIILGVLKNFGWQVKKKNKTFLPNHKGLTIDKATLLEKTGSSPLWAVCETD